MFGLVFLSIQLQISANNALFSLSAIELIFFIFTTPMKIFSTLLVRFIENALDKTLNAFLYGFGTSIEFVLSNQPPNCRVKRHLITNPSQQHARPAEIKLDSTICAQLVKMGYILLDPKLYAKVLRICVLIDILIYRH